MAPALDIRGLRVEYAGAAGTAAAVRDVSLQVAAGECVGIVGESGSGKTQVFMAAMGLLGAAAAVSGSVRFDGRELLRAPRAALNAVRGSRLTMVFQDPMSCLTPHLRVGVQLAEVLAVHKGWSRRRAGAGALDMLRRMQIPDAERRMRQYPHELSGGLRQRVMIGMSLLCDPDVLIADEPTTALDVTVQAQILDLLCTLRRETRTGIVLISHDFALVAGIAQRILVMYAGRIVESAAAPALLRHAHHPYSAALLACVPPLTGPRWDRLPSLPGQAPQPTARLEGCAFAPRCPRASARCAALDPVLRRVDADSEVACHHPVPA